ncbi:hypothetical protein BWQ93_12230 [Sphingopyxis sp. QXT-31]|uniref:hypothetical protein n=1 Tax=Sphingopyxis sp. QXT-31 TaxID=1357916 RepID=UPI0009794430|nr:hypothetical protein [Sphingopyxis sp. QXT-31]APZ99173.1 hypothetical protein BWQ93_12230 [Sphingopyxis sp. QXT-31]
MDRPQRRIGRRLAIAAVVLCGLAAAVWAILPNGKLARIERHARCYDPAALPQVETLADGRKAMRLRVLLWNVEGLPWPIRSGRAPKLAAIAGWIAKRRKAGLGPDILILHKAFTPEASRIATAAGYANILPGPAVDRPRHMPVPIPLAGHAEAGRWWKGEGIGKWLDSGLYVATDLPLPKAIGDPPLPAYASDAFYAGSCAGYDCLSNKGGMIVHAALPGAPEPLAIFNTHRNSREPSGVSIARAEAAHVMQTLENDALLHGFGGNGAMIAAGDFNNYRAGDKTGRFATDPAFRLAAKGAGFAARAAPMTDAKAWTDAYDLLGFRSSSAMRVEPLAVATLFDGKNGPVLSDHAAQYVIFRLSWRADAPAAPVLMPTCTL